MAIDLLGCERGRREFEQLVRRMDASAACPQCRSDRVCRPPAVCADDRSGPSASPSAEPACPPWAGGSCIL
ncbi:MAG: hypothetical protein KGY81_06510 [Phycisphaerae bacterium]|jgi:hypothetical protein|nr:hypothetical protein [Phycisphaerae bacterium]